jgi:folate-binding protein YgfZ
MVALTYLSIVRFSGTDAGDFLHKQISGDVLGLENGDSVFACYCEPKGRVLALMLVCRSDETYYVVMSRSLVQTITNRLKMYVMRSKVNIEVLDGCAVAGLEMDEIPDTPALPVPAIPLPDKSRWFMATTGDEATGDGTTSQDNWKTSELIQGIAWLQPETSGQFLPQWLGYDQLGAVNFRKGCYPGQEIIARTHYLGKVKRHPRVLNAGAIIHPQAVDEIQITSGEQSYVAVVVDYALGDDGNTCLFVVTRMDPDLVAEHVEYEGHTARVI